MILLRKHIIQNLIAFQFYGILAGVRSSEAGIAEFNGVENEAIALLNRFPDWSNNPTAGEVIRMANRIKELRGKYNKLFGYKQHSSDETLCFIYKNSYEDFFTKGITLSELQKIVDISKTLKFGHFLQTYMLTDNQSKNMRCAVVEFLENAQYFYNEAWRFYHEKKKLPLPSTEDFIKTPEIERARFHSEGELKIRFFKEAFINLILFVESFINAVGYDAFLQNFHSNPEEELNLKGQFSKKGNIHFLKISDKIRFIPKIINKSLKYELNPEDEPYKTYFDNFVNLRNTYIHTSPAKGNTWFSAEDWKIKNDTLIDQNCFQVIDAFWKACYPNKSFPLYIKKIYYSDGFLGRQKKYFAFPA